VRVLIDTTFARRGRTGTGIYLSRLIEALAALGVDVVQTANESRRPPAGGGLGSIANAAADQWWTAVELGRRARRMRADVVHHPLPALGWRIARPQVVTVHDLAFERLPEHFDAWFRRYARLTHRAAARRADAVVAVSRTTALDVMSRWGVPAQRIVVAPHGPGQQLDVPRRGGRPRHFLYVGDDEPRKNLDALLVGHRLYRETAGAAALPLVVAGAAAAPGRASAADGVQLVELPAPGDLATLHAQAAALVHPALYEGFGLTPLEAMAAGTPVIAARSPGVVEVCAEAALYFDPREPSTLAAALARVAGDAALRRDLSRRGRRRAATFSWARSARAHVEAYTLAVEAPRRTSRPPA
jgi:glycosyltransferase involved in cell wall biosynthesis